MTPRGSLKLFVAVVPPPDVLDHLEAAVREVRDEQLRWAGTDTWHVTLAFYGDIHPDRLDELDARVRRGAHRHPPAELHLAGAGRFGSAVLWMGVGGDVTTLRRHARTMAAAGRRVGAEPDRHDRYRPHVTLARSRRPADLRPYVGRLAGYAGPSWVAAEATLFSSHQDDRPGHPPRYEVLGRFPLEGVTERPRRPR